MKRINIIIMISLLLFAMDCFLSAEKSHAIPAFARRHNLSCSTCHAPIPKLKPYGADFAGDGFMIPEDEKERDYISAGDPLLHLNKTFPIGVRFDAYAMHESGQKVKNDLQSPWGIKLLSGGTLGQKIGYYFYFYMSERGEVAGIEDAYVHFNDVFSAPLDIMVGQFQTSDPLLKRELRLSYEDYMIYKHKTGLSHTNLAYDRGVMLVYGVEQTGTDLVLSFTNGNGKNTADEATGKFDMDAQKNLGFRVLQGIGETMSIGGFYYHGEEVFDSGEGDRSNTVTYWGPDVNVTAGPVELTAQYLQRKDTNPWFTSTDQEFKTDGVVVELILSPQKDRSRYYFTALYNSIKQNSEGAIASGSLLTAYESATLSATYLVQRNMRLIAEYSRDLENKQNRLIFGLISGF